MHVTPSYCRTMARYNAWQNDGLRRIAETIPVAELTRDRGAFFGSIMATLNHLLWADLMWMHRFTGDPRPEGGIRDSVALTPTPAAWSAARFRTDGRITLWAEGLNAVDMVGDHAWHSGATGREMRKPFQILAMHFFNHQTHHRGQVHAMLTGAGITPPDTDLFLMQDLG